MKNDKEYFDKLLEKHQEIHKSYCLAINNKDITGAYGAYIGMKEIEGHWHNLAEFSNALYTYISSKSTR
jgi:hypothetical protein